MTPFDMVQDSVLSRVPEAMSLFTFIAAAKQTDLRPSAWWYWGISEEATALA
jgi:hypothetical protein